MTVVVNLDWPRGPLRFIGALIWICTSFAHTAESAPEIPAKVLEGGRRLLVERAGRDFVERFITLDSSGCNFYSGTTRGRVSSPPSTPSSPAEDDTSGKTPRLPSRSGGETPRWTLAYRLAVKAKPWVKGNVSFEVDTIGHCAGGRGFYGLSDCVAHPEECTFAVDQKTALATARRTHFAVGLKPWKVEFQWQAVAKPSSYAWAVTNTTYLSADGCSGSGQCLVIDASTGRVLTTTNLSWVCDFISPREHFPSEAESVSYESAPVPIVSPSPVLPEFAREAGIHGEVILRVLVGTDGHIKDVRVVRGVNELNEAAIQTVKKWIFQPALSGGKPVAVWTDLRLSFPP